MVSNRILILFHGRLVMDTPNTERLPRTRWSYAALFGLLGAVVVAIVVMAFVWPAATSEVRDLPVAIAGPDEQVALVETALAEQDPQPFVLQPVDSREEAVELIETRAIYGAILLGEEPEVLIATAA